MVVGMLGKILGIASIGEALSGLHLARKFVIDVAVVIMLTIIGSMMAGAIAIAGLYESDAVLVRHGLDPDMAALFTGLLALLMLGIIIAVIAFKIHRMQNFPFRIAGRGLPGSSLQSVVRGFCHGMTNKNPF
jgi:hypothetical protein